LPFCVNSGVTRTGDFPRFRFVATLPVIAYLEGHRPTHHQPDLQAKLDRWVTETGRGPDELVEDAITGYFDELARTREMLDNRYDGLKSGRVKPICRDDLIAHFREKRAAARRTQSGEWSPMTSVRKS
jgi:hypothetical protein